MLTSARLCKNHFVHGRLGEASHRVESVELELDRNKFLSFRSMSDDLDTYKEPITYCHKMKLGIKSLKRYLHYNASFHSSSWCVI